MEGFVIKERNCYGKQKYSMIPSERTPFRFRILFIWFHPFDSINLKCFQSRYQFSFQSCQKAFQYPLGEILLEVVSQWKQNEPKFFIVLQSRIKAIKCQLQMGIVKCKNVATPLSALGINTHIGTFK